MSAACLLGASVPVAALTDKAKARRMSSWVVKMVAGEVTGVP